MNKAKKTVKETAFSSFKNDNALWQHNPEIAGIVDQLDNVAEEEQESIRDNTVWGECRNFQADSRIGQVYCRCQAVEPE